MSCGVGILPDGGGLRASVTQISGNRVSGTRDIEERTTNMHEPV
jgi:hypothetical protein